MLGKLLQGLYIEIMAGIRLHIAHGDFSCVYIWLTHGGGEADGGMCTHGLFDELGFNIMSTAYDEFFFTPSEPEVAIGILPRQVAGIEPALTLVIIQPQALVLMLQLITQKHIRPTNGQGPNLIGVALAQDLVALDLHTLHLLIRDA